MPKARESRIAEAQGILAAFGLPPEQRNERAALTLLALVEVKPSTKWPRASAPLMGVTPIMDFAKKHYGKEWAPNTRETVRRFTLHQFVQAGLAVPNPDNPERPTNSPSYCYQVEATALAVIQKYDSTAWDAALRLYLSSVETLQKRYKQAREMARIPLTLAPGVLIKISPGGQNELVKQIVEEFCPQFTPGATPVYVGDTNTKWAFFDASYLASLGVADAPGHMIHFNGERFLGPY
jgi:hypothetical protein